MRHDRRYRRDAGRILGTLRRMDIQGVEGNCLRGAAATFVAGTPVILTRWRRSAS